MPKLTCHSREDGWIIGVEGINRIVLRGDINHISNLSSNRKIRDVGRLSINLTVYRKKAAFQRCLRSHWKS